MARKKQYDRPGRPSAIPSGERRPVMIWWPRTLIEQVDVLAGSGKRTEWIITAVEKAVKEASVRQSEKLAENSSQNP